MAFGWDDAGIMAVMAAASAGASYASSAVGSAQNTHVARKMAKYNLRNAKEQMKVQDELQRAYSKDMTKWGLLTNPAYKMAGLKAAGLNPILAYDSGNSALASASYSGVGGAQLGNQQVDFAGSVRDAFSSAMDKKRRDNETDLKDANVDNIKTNTEKSRTEADLTATKVSTEEMNQDVLEARKKQIEEETAKTRLDNDLKSATNARDIFRAKTDYEVESTRREMAEKHNLYHGFAPPHDSPYGHKREMELGKDTYLDNPTRQKVMDWLGGIFGTAKAVGNLMPKKH